VDIMFESLLLSANDALAPRVLGQATPMVNHYAKVGRWIFFQWLFNVNEIHVFLLWPDEPMFYRSQARTGELASACSRARRSMIKIVFGRGGAPANHRRLALRKERRTYELGRIPRSIGGRSDCSELTEFAV
jgi:hypothetical protein